MHSTLDKFLRPPRATRKMTPSSSCRHRPHPPSIAPRLPPLAIILLALLLPLADAIPDECLLPLDTGDGGFVVVRYFYSSAKGECVSFLYWSTGGNDNNFGTLDDCEDTCMSSSASPTQPTIATTSTTPTMLEVTVSTETTPTVLETDQVAVTTETSPTPITTEAVVGAPSKYPTEICHLPKFNIPCPAINVVARYWYNKGTNNCEMFFFFSCQGNENNFVSFEECMATCEVVASSPPPSPSPSPSPSPTPSSSLDTPPPSPSLTQTSAVSTVAMETTLSVPPPINPPSVQPHPPQSTAIPPSPSPLAPSNGDDPTGTVPIPTGPTTVDELPSVWEPYTVRPEIPSPTEGSDDSEDSMDQNLLENSRSESHSRTLSTFDIASIGVGVLALLLGVLLVAIVILLVCKRRWRLERLKAINYAAASQSRLGQFSYDSKI